MPVERHQISVSQFCELMAIDPARFIALERTGRSSTLTIVMEGEDMNTSGTMPQLTTGKKIGGGKKGGGKRGC